MTLSLIVTPHGRLLVQDDSHVASPVVAPAVSRRITAAFDESTARGLLQLATAELESALPLTFAFARDFARTYLTRLCHMPAVGETGAPLSLPPPPDEELSFHVMQAPPLHGAEYLSAEVLADWWRQFDALVFEELAAFAGDIQAWLQEKNPLWRLVGRVTFHLAENKRDPDRPFAFLATYAHRLSAQGKIQHLPLNRALQEYTGAGNRQALLTLLTPIHRATERSAMVKELVDSGRVYQPLVWTPREAYRFLQDLPSLEDSGIIVRVPNWWKPASPPRAKVSLRIGEAAVSRLGADALLDFKVSLTLDGETLTDDERRQILAAEGGLISIRGKWIEVDRDKLAEALDHWKTAERQSREGGISFHEGMRLLSGAALAGDASADIPAAAREWTGITPGRWLETTLAELRSPSAASEVAPPGLQASLRPYQHTGVQWLLFMTRLGLGACLADDMGLGKTIQVIALLLHEQRRKQPRRENPSILVVPASLIANWKSEIARFAPGIHIAVAHPSEWTDAQEEGRWQSAADSDLPPCDVVLTTYGMLARLDALRKRPWRLAILDEAQAIKNAGTRQARSVKELTAAARIALTGTPVENRLSDLWSIFDFLNPGLLGTPKAFTAFTRQLAADEHRRYGPLRHLVKPYILRRLKTDKTVIADLPEKTEVRAYCTLSRPQAALYQQAVDELDRTLRKVDGIQRRGAVLAALMRFKQICNHPAQWRGDGLFDPQLSGKFQRLGELCSALAERQEKALIFTQFREMTEPLAEFLRGVFQRDGLVLHGQTPVAKRQQLVNDFQRDGGPPFFVLSIKAGGTGLNLTAAAHVIHFDRWWNPAVENQATDRAFRIGQKKNVLVHKFVCRGTVEENIDKLIAEKTAISQDILDGGGERLITEMNNDDLLRFVSLDIHRAVE